MIQMSKPEPKRNKLYPEKLFLFLGARNYSLRKTVPGLSSGCHNETITKYRSLGGVYFLAIPKAGSPGSGCPSGLVGACPCLCALVSLFSRTLILLYQDLTSGPHLTLIPSRLQIQPHRGLGLQHVNCTGAQFRPEHDHQIFKSLF